jgi:protein Tex
VLEGMVTNVAAFGAFVDVGVHQDGLVHVSAMSKTFVQDPRDVVKPGDVVRVKVLDVDVPRNRISLTLRLDDPAEPKPPAGAPRQPSKSRTAAARTSSAQRPSVPKKPVPGGALADALRRAGYDEQR